MIKIGIIGSKLYENKARIKAFIFGLRQQTDQPIQIVGLGGNNGANKYVKKYALELGYSYKEFNPPHTVQNVYSALPETFYNKPFNPKGLAVRNSIFANYVDKCVFFSQQQLSSDSTLKSVDRNLRKLGKSSVLIS